MTGLRLWLTLSTLLLWSLAPVAVRADALDDGVRRVALQLQCPVCEGESVADSPSGLATDMRSLIRTRLAAGATDQQILDEFVAAYGDGILAEPPKRGVSLGVWLGPPLAVLFGAGALIALLRAWRRPSRRSPTVASAVDTDALEEYRRFRQEVGT